jgi:dUTP pyrophosphatase
MYALRVKLIDPNAKIPTKSSEGAAGLDLYAAHDLIIKPNDKAILDTGISCEFPYGCYGRIAPRSSASYCNHFLLSAGVIDNDFRGTIKLLIFNLGHEPFVIKTGDSHAQLILEKICIPTIEVVDDLSKTDRKRPDIDRYHLTQMIWNQK